MNPYVIKSALSKHLNQRVIVNVYGMRNKNQSYIGILKDIYPKIFTIDCNDKLYSFSYSDIINGEVKLKFL